MLKTTPRPKPDDIRYTAVQLRSAHGPLAAELLDLELNGESGASARRRLTRVLKAVRRLDRQDDARGAPGGLSVRDLWVLGLAALACAVAVYLVVRG